MPALAEKLRLPSADEALPGRAAAIPTSPTHFINGSPLNGPFASAVQLAMFGMGCFWGAERLFWKLDGVVSTAVGYAGGLTPNPTYEEVCSGRTGHAEVVRVAFDPALIAYEALLKTFWENHDPTQGMRQGADVGSQYRSAIFTCSDDQAHLAEASRDAYGQTLAARGLGPVTTEIAPAPAFYFAEGYHQQYQAKNPAGYCGIGGTGVVCPIDVGAEARDDPG